MLVLSLVIIIKLGAFSRLSLMESPDDYLDPLPNSLVSNSLMKYSYRSLYVCMDISVRRWCGEEEK